MMERKKITTADEIKGPKQKSGEPIAIDSTGAESLCAGEAAALYVSVKVLVMDDDPIVRGALGMMLDFLGHESSFACAGDEALSLYERAFSSERPFDVVILDLTIPNGMGGEETMKRLLDMDPGVRAIVSSGYYEDPVMSDYRRYGFKAAIAKPYGMNELGEVIKRLVRAKR